MQVYSNPERENDTHALPDVEVFYVDHEEALAISKGYCVIEGYTGIGYYWWPCFPGCYPDGDAIGPFTTESEAITDAQDQE